MMGLWRRILRVIRRWGPPVALGVWAVHFYFEMVGYAVPAFGPIDNHLAAYRSHLLGELGLGGAIALIWAASWVLGSPHQRPRAGRAYKAKTEAKRWTRSAN